jgi:hypothetical protein
MVVLEARMRLHATIVAFLVLGTVLMLSGCTLIEQVRPSARIDALGGRVELPEAGIAVTFPDDWLRESPPSLAGGGVAAVLEPDQRELLVPLLKVMPPSRHDWCVVADITPLVEAQAEWQTLDDVVGGLERRLAADPRWVGLGTTILGLPAGPTGQITRSVAHEASSVTTFIFTQPEAWSMLECFAQTVRPKDWLPIAESFEFVREE